MSQPIRPRPTPRPEPKTKEERISHELTILQAQVAWLRDEHTEAPQYNRNIVRTNLRYVSERIDRLSAIFYDA